MSTNEALDILRAKGLTDEELRNVDFRVLTALAESNEILQERNEMLFRLNEQYNRGGVADSDNDEDCDSDNDEDYDCDDAVSHPTHYTAGSVECIDAIESATEGLQGIEAVCTGNVIKYAWRWKLKNGVEDLHKARWYLDKLIAKQNN